MKFALLSGEIRTVVVVYPVRYVRGLLYFGQKYPAAYRMYASRRYVKTVPFFYRNGHKQVCQVSAFEIPEVFLTRCLPFKPGYQRRTGIGIHHIPHFCLAGTVMTSHSRRIVGMYLYGQIVRSAYELDQKRKAVAVAAVYLSACKRSSVFTHKAVEHPAFQRTAVHTGHISWNG